MSDTTPPPRKRKSAAKPAPKAPAPTPKKDTKKSNELPLWFRMSVISTLSVLLVVHVITDIFVKTYNGQATSLMLGGIVGTALGVNEYLRGKGGADDE